MLIDFRNITIKNIEGEESTAGNFLAVIQESLNPIFDKIMNTEEIETSAEEIKDEQTTC